MAKLLIAFVLCLAVAAFADFSYAQEEPVDVTSAFAAHTISIISSQLETYPAAQAEKGNQVLENAKLGNEACLNAGLPKGLTIACLAQVRSEALSTLHSSP